MESHDEDRTTLEKKQTVAIDGTECSVPCTTERANEVSCRLASTESQETTSTTTSGNAKHAFSSALQPDSMRYSQQTCGPRNTNESLKSCVISILSEKPCGMTQLKKLLDTKGVSVVGARGSSAHKGRRVRHVTQEELSVLLKQISVYRPPGMYVLREEYQHARDPSQELAMDRLLSRLVREGDAWNAPIGSEEDYRRYCAEYEETYATAFRIHQQLRMTQESHRSSLYNVYTRARQHLECIKEKIERYQEKF